MASRSKRKKQADPVHQLAHCLPKRLRTRFLLVVNIAILAIGAVWFSFQPKARQQEVSRIIANYLDSNRKIQLTELAYDIYSLYYGTPAVPCDYKPGDAPVYGGMPVRSDGTKLTILPNRAYWVGYDEARRNPAWSAYKLMHIKEPNPPQERPSQFFTDDRTIAKVASDDYTGSGFDRGHLAPNNAIARCFGPLAQQETFLMSNIVPQRHAINAGNWKALEIREAVNYPDRFDTIWVIAGPVFTSPTPRRLPGGLPVPDAFYKIHVDRRNDGIRTQAFIFKQKGNGKENLETLLVSVRDIERLTGLDFFPELPRTIQDQLEASPAASLW